METIKKIVTEEMTVYVAADGEEFRDRGLCMRYERKLEERKRIETIRDMLISCDPVPFAGLKRTDRLLGYSDRWMWFALRSREDVRRLEEAMDPQFVCQLHSLASQFEEHGPDVAIICKWDGGGQMFLLSELRKSARDFLQATDRFAAMPADGGKKEEK